MQLLGDCFMRILVDGRVLTGADPGGVQRYASLITRALKKQANITVDVVKPPFKRAYVDHLFEQIYPALISARYDLIFAPGNTAPLFGSRNTRLVVTMHDVAFMDYPETFSRAFCAYYRCLFRLLSRRADRIITVSHFSKSRIIRHFPGAAERVYVIYPPLSKVFMPLNFVVKQDAILYVGSANERKNPAGTIEAFLKLKSRTLKLWMVGGFYKHFRLSERTRKLFAKAEETANVRFFRNLDDKGLVELYNRAKLLLFPSLYEGFGYPIVEAFACGCPVITSGREPFIEVGGDAAMYCNPDSVDDIKEKLERLLDDETLQSQMRDRGFERARLFDEEKTLKKHIQLFEAIVNG